MTRTSKQRVLDALKHREPDKIPIDFAATRVTGIHALAYNRLTSYLKIESNGARVYDVPQMLAEPEEPMLDYFESDVVQLHRLVPAPAVGLKIDSYKQGSLNDGSPAYFPSEYNPIEDDKGNLHLYNDKEIPIYWMPKDGYYFSREYNPLGGAETQADIDRFDLHEFMPGENKWLEQELQSLKNQERAIIGQFGGNFLERGNRLFGMENFLIKLLTEPVLIEHFMNRLLEATIEDFDKYHASVGDRVDIVQLNDDMGTQEAPLISPKLYTSIIKPYQKQFYEHIRKNSKMFIFLHSCGSINELIPHLIEIGVDILNPVQYSARNMDAEKLKREYGQDLVFWGGGCDTQSVLAAESPEKVREETEKMIDILSSQGGFIFAQVHNIQPTVPMENIAVMFETIKEKR